MVYVRRGWLDAHTTNNYEGAVSSGSFFVSGTSSKDMAGIFL